MNNGNVLSDVIQNIKTQVNDIKNKISTVQQHIYMKSDEKERDFDKLFMYIVNVLNEINDILILFSSTTNELYSLTVKFNEINNKLQEIKSNVNELQSSLETKLKNQIIEQNLQFEKNKYEIDDLKQEIQEIKDSIKNIQETLEQTGQQLRQVEEQLSPVVTYLDEYIKPMINQNKEFKRTLVITLIGSGGIIAIIIQELLKLLIK